MSAVESLRQTISEHGAVTFAELMRIVLYGPEGYYTTNAPMGFSGDYLTAPETTPLFGATLSRLAAATWRALGRPIGFEVVDVGAGTGALLRDLIAALREEDPECSAAAEFVAIEVSDAAVQKQARSLGGMTVKRANSIEALGPISGLVIANELLDALPFHLVTRRQGELRELRVALGDGAFEFIDADLSDARLSEETPELDEDERAAVPLAAYDWLASLGKALESGVAVLIDYPSDERGGPLAYFRHTVGADPLDRLGRQDLSTTLDFTRLRRAAERAGFDVVGDRPQADFLAELGFDERVRAIGSGSVIDPASQIRAASARNAARSIVDPEGMGQYSVLVLSKGLSL